MVTAQSQSPAVVKFNVFYNTVITYIFSDIPATVNLLINTIVSYFNF